MKKSYILFLLALLFIVVGGYLIYKDKMIVSKKIDNNVNLVEYENFNFTNFYPKFDAKFKKSNIINPKNGKVINFLIPDNMEKDVYDDSLKYYVGSNVQVNSLIMEDNSSKKDIIEQEKLRYKDYNNFEIKETNYKNIDYEASCYYIAALKKEKKDNKEISYYNESFIVLIKLSEQETFVLKYNIDFQMFDGKTLNTLMNSISITEK